MPRGWPRLIGGGLAEESNIHRIDFFSLLLLLLLLLLSPPSPPFCHPPLCVKLLATVIDHRARSRSRDGDVFPPARAGRADRRRRDCRLCRRDSQLSNPICPPERQWPDGQRGRERDGKRVEKGRVGRSGGGRDRR